MEKVQREEKNGYVLYHNPGGKTIGTATGRVILSSPVGRTVPSKSKTSN